jgi:hypothetical protein
MDSSPEREGRGKGKRERAAQLGCSWGHHGEGEGYRRGVRHGTLPSCSSVRCCCLHAVLFVRKKRRKERRKRKGRKRKEKKRKKRKNMENFPNMKNFGEKNKRQFMKLVKNIF